MSEIPHGHRRSIRLPEWDYRWAGAYFVTLVTASRECVFEDPVLLQIAETLWARIVNHADRVTLDAWVVMPNHVHGILIFAGAAAPGQSRSTGSPSGAAAGSLGAIIGNYKVSTARRINAIRRTPGVPVWQRNYYERIIRNDRELQAVRRYIQDNPARWAEDAENPRA